MPLSPDTEPEVTNGRRRVVRSRRVFLSSDVDALLFLTREAVAGTVPSARILEIADTFEWEPLAELAQQQGVLPLLYWYSERAGFADLADQALAQLARDALNIACNNLVLTSDLIRVLELLQKEAIPVICYKGPILALHTYGSLSLRQFCDLDILVAPEDVRRAGKLLAASGFVPRFQFSAGQERMLFRSNHAMQLVGRGGRVIELHWRLAPRYFFSGLSWADLWRRSRAFSLEGSQVTIPSDEDMLLISCIHGSKHCWQRLNLVSDVAKIVKACPDIDWHLVTELATREGCRRMLLTGLSLAERLLGLQLEPKIKAALRPDRRSEHLAKGFARRWTHPPITTGSLFERLHHHVRLMDSQFCRAIAVLRYFTQPTIDDWRFLRLAAKLQFLYAFIRPVRLLIFDPLMKWLPRWMKKAGKRHIGANIPELKESSGCFSLETD